MCELCDRHHMGFALERVVANQVLHEPIHMQADLCLEQIIVWLQTRLAIPANRAEASPVASGVPPASPLNGDLAGDAAGYRTRSGPPNVPAVRLSSSESLCRRQDA